MRKLTVIFLTALSLVLLVSCSNTETEEEPMTYTNPVLEPVFADPTVIKADDGYFYAYATEDFFNYDTGTRTVAIFRSKDLVNWEDMGNAFETKPEWKSFGFIWAPDIQFFNGQYYLYYSMSVWGDANPGIGVATASTPVGPFEDQGKLFDSEEIGVPNSIDPFVYTTESNTKWMFWGSFHGIYAIQLSEDGLSTVGEKVHIAGNAFEASYVIQKDNYYYLFLSSGSCCDGANSSYQVKVGRSTSLLGPYQDRLGRNLKYSSGSLVLGDGDTYVGNGHNTMAIDDNGDFWLLYHGINKEEPYLPNGATRRPLLIDKIVWDNDGWPQIKNFRPSESETEVPYFKEEN
ncbi:MAG: family 43 glycosylhydrolase [Candidatus Izimaplasma sp.]|nr:family 43 glycosylhydrolase [Candidatus Izimaplasma bacterium]